MQPHEIAAAIIGVFCIIGTWVSIGAIKPVCPFCGGRMTRTLKDCRRLFCHRCGASKHGDHYISGEGWHDRLGKRPAGRASDE